MKNAFLFLALTISNLTFAKNIENVLIGPGLFPTQSNEFIKCLAKTAFDGSELQFLGIGSVNLLTNDSLRLEIQVLVEDSQRQSGFFKIIASTADTKHGWQKIYAADKNIFYFSNSVSSVALLTREGSEFSSMFGFEVCGN